MEIWRILTERWEAGDDLIFTREANIAEMNVSEPPKNALKLLQKIFCRKKLQVVKIYILFVKNCDFARISSIFDGFHGFSHFFDQILGAQKNPTS